MRSRFDLRGQRFGRLLVLEQTQNSKISSWLCQCDCGSTIIVAQVNLRFNRTKSCGCLHREVAKKIADLNFKTHGLSRSIDPKIRTLYSMFKHSRRNLKVPNNLTMEYMIQLNFPDYCPVLGVKLNSSIKITKDNFDWNAPTLDRIIPEKGYVEGNVQIISYRANTIKSCGTAEEHIKIANYISKNIEVN